MQRIDTSTRSVDLFGTGKDGFKDGNVGLGIAATAFNAAWCNSVQEEVANAIEAAGLVLNLADNNQLLDALNAGWDLPKTKSSNGYIKLPGGVILQWFSAGLSTTPVTITMPITFPTGRFALVSQVNASTSIGGNGWIGSTFLSNSQISAVSANGAPNCSFLAIGH